MANHSSAVLTHQVYPTVPKVQPDPEDFETEPSSRAYEGPTDQPLQDDAAYSKQLIASDSYNLVTGAELLEAPLTESHRSQGAPDAEGGIERHSASPLLGRLYSNPSAVSSGSFRSQSSAAPKSNSWESISGAAPYNNSLQNMLVSGASMLAASTSTATAQLLIGGLQGGSFDGDHRNDPSGVYYPSPNHQQEAMQLYYVNAGFSHGFSLNGRSGVVTTLMYPPQDGGTSAQQASCAQSQDQYGVPFLPATLAHTALNQQALEAISPAGRIPLPLQELSESNGNQSYGNWRHGGNEHSFLPTHEASQSTRSQFGTDLPQYGVARASHDLSHMHQTDHLQGDVAHGLHLDHSHGSSINGQGLSLSLSSHQPQSAALHFHSPGGQLPDAEHINAAAVLSQAAAIARTEAVSRYFTEANAGLSRFRTPSTEDGLGTRFQLEQVDVGGRKHVESSMSARSSNHFSASRFLRSAQEILNEVCRVSSLKRPPKPARSSEQHWNMAAGSSASIDGNLTYHAKEDRGAMLTEVDSARDPLSLTVTSPLITVSHVSHASEMNQSLADTARTENRDDLERKKGKLGVMLDEVEARYRRYCDQLQLVTAGFNSQAGSNAATPYTILALQAMSRHFRCLRDAIGSQQRVVKRALGENDRTGRGETSRLRYVDQQMRQQRALQQLDMLQQHAWRPQRGLPERAVSVLRAWLFEHFLHPYPKDVDKLSLAKQTGLTRSQVSNWFINARVRLWKPMVEEMYLEEQREADEAAASERMARDQADTGRNSYKEYERGRGHSGLLNEVTENGLSSTMQKDMKDSEDTEHDAGPSDKEGEGELCPNSQLLAAEHELEVGAEGTYNQEGREAKKARNFEGLDEEAGNRAKSRGYSTDGEDICNGDTAFGTQTLNRDEEIYSLSQKGAANVDQLESAVGGAFGTYERNNLQKYSLEAHSGSASRASATIIPTTSNGVSLTLGLRHSEANLRSSMGPSIIPKYNVNMDDQTNQLNKVDQFDGQIDISNNCGQSTAGFSNGHYLQMSQDHSNNSNQQLASQTRHHEFVAN